MFTPLAVGLLVSACVTAQSVPQTILDAGYVVVLKKELRLELLRQAKVIKTYEVALRSRRAQDQTGRPQDAGRRLRSGFPQSSQTVPQVNPHLVSLQKGVSPGGKAVMFGQNRFPTHRPGGTALPKRIP